MVGERASAACVACVAYVASVACEEGAEAEPEAGICAKYVDDTGSVACSKVDLRAYTLVRRGARRLRATGISSLSSIVLTITGASKSWLLVNAML